MGTSTINVQCTCTWHREELLHPCNCKCAILGFDYHYHSTLCCSTHHAARLSVILLFDIKVKES